MTQQEQRQQSCRDFHAKPGGTYEEDWFQVFGLSGIPTELTYDEQLYSYLRGFVGEQGSLPGCQHAFATLYGADSWNGLGTFLPTFSFDLSGTESSFWNRERASVGTYRNPGDLLRFAPIDNWRPDYDQRLLGDLNEEQRTNEVRNSDMTGAAVGDLDAGGSVPTGWSFYTASGVFRIFIDEIGIEDGYSFLQFRFIGTNNAGGSMATGVNFTNTTDVVAAQNEFWASSFFARTVNGAGSHSLTHLIVERTAAGAFINQFEQVETLSGTRTRKPFVQELTSATTARVQTGIQFLVPNGETLNVTFRVYPPQLEKSKFASSPIIDSGGPNTRAQDTLVMPPASFTPIYDASKGTIFFRGQLQGADSNSAVAMVWQVSDAAADTNRFGVFHSSGSTELKSFMRAVGVDQIPEGPFDVGLDPFAIAFSYAANDVRIYINGTQVVSDNTVTLPAGMDRLGIFNSSNSGAVANGWAQGFAYSAETASDEFMQRWSDPQLPAQAAVLSDTFTAADNTLLTAHTPDVSPGGSYTLTTTDATAPAANSARIIGNKLALFQSAEGGVFDTGLSDVEIEIDITHATGGRYGVILRHASNGNMLICRVRGPEGLIELVTATAGIVAAVGASETLTVSNGVTYRYRIQAKGQGINVFRDGAFIFSRAGVSNFETATAQGVTSFGSTLGERYDNLIVRPL